MDVGLKCLIWQMNCWESKTSPYEWYTMSHIMRPLRPIENCEQKEYSAKTYTYMVMGQHMSNPWYPSERPKHLQERRNLKKVGTLGFDLIHVPIVFSVSKLLESHSTATAWSLPAQNRSPTKRVAPAQRHPWSERENFWRTRSQEIPWFNSCWFWWWWHVVTSLSVSFSFSAC